MTLIETHPSETEAELRAVVERILNTLDPEKLNWWYPFELRGTYQSGDKFYREFFCIAGSVQMWLWKLTTEGNMGRTVLMLPENAIHPAG
jgi:hypothetical protein